MSLQVAVLSSFFTVFVFLSQASAASTIFNDQPNEARGFVDEIPGGLPYSGSPNPEYMVYLDVYSCVLTPEKVFKIVTTRAYDLVTIPYLQATKEPNCVIALKVHELLYKTKVSYEEIMAGYAQHGNDRVAQRISTVSMAIFTLDQSVPELGEAWRAPSGLIWGDVRPEKKTISEAEKDCRCLTAKTKDCSGSRTRLPTSAELDELAAERGYTNISGYILANEEASILGVPNYFALNSNDWTIPRWSKELANGWIYYMGYGKKLKLHSYGYRYDWPLDAKPEYYRCVAKASGPPPTGSQRDL